MHKCKKQAHDVSVSTHKHECRKTETGFQACRHANILKDRHNTHADMQTHRQTLRQTGTQACKLADTQACRQMNRQTHRQTNRLGRRLANMQTDRYAFSTPAKV